MDIGQTVVVSSATEVSSDDSQWFTMVLGEGLVLGVSLVLDLGVGSLGHGGLKRGNASIECRNNPEPPIRQKKVNANGSNAFYKEV